MHYHTDYTDGEAFSMLHNEKLGMATILRFDKTVFPLLRVWKSMRAGDYALGLEPGETREFNITLVFTDDAAEIDSYKARAYKASI